MFFGAIRGFADFLFPKPEEVYALESLSPGELLAKLPAPFDTSALDESTIALFAYPDPRVRELVWELKYRRNVHLAESLAILLYDLLREELAERALYENFSKPFLIPAPMSLERLRKRGWNQTEILCDEVKKLDTENLLEYRRDLLKKSKHTESQTKVSKPERQKNVHESMLASEDVRGRNIVVLDDVTTTGATFKEIRRALRQAGALKVLCIAVAH